MSRLFLSLNLMDLLSSLFQKLLSSIELIMFILVIGGGFFLLIQARAKPLLLIKTSFKLLFSKEDGEGISRFQALSAVLASTVGLGNISGVAIAIHMGGPGVLVWMWVTAIIGAVIKWVLLVNYGSSSWREGGSLCCRSLLCWEAYVI